MTDNEVFILSRQHETNNPFLTDVKFSTDQLLAFANACEKIGMEKAAKICDKSHGRRNGCSEAICKETK